MASPASRMMSPSSQRELRHLATSLWSRSRRRRDEDVRPVTSCDRLEAAGCWTGRMGRRSRPPHVVHSRFHTEAFSVELPCRSRGWRHDSPRRTMGSDNDDPPGGARLDGNTIRPRGSCGLRCWQRSEPASRVTGARQVHRDSFVVSAGTGRRTRYRERQHFAHQRRWFASRRLQIVCSQHPSAAGFGRARPVLGRRLSRGPG